MFFGCFFVGVGVCGFLCSFQFSLYFFQKGGKYMSEKKNAT